MGTESGMVEIDVDKLRAQLEVDEGDPVGRIRPVESRVFVAVMVPRLAREN